MKGPKPKFMKPKAWKPQVVIISYIFPLPFFPLALHASRFKLCINLMNDQPNYM